ncbi:CbtA family protein [Mycolicibacterium sp.]|uniref:CbtA family protein n=1 Tax=Mycolicibacterium sp. TaxID=2320850 RepID=UPI003D112E01
MKKIIGIGLASGALAGAAAFAYSRIQVAPLIAEAIGYEEDRAHALAELTGEHSHSHELFTRAVQENVGAGVGVIGYGVVLGALFAVAYAVLTSGTARNRLEPRWAALGLSVVALVSVSLVPFLVFPANPPGVGQEETSAQRTTSYLALLIISVLTAAVLAAVVRRYSPRVGTWPAAVAAGWAYAGVIAVAAALMPRVQEVPAAVTDGTGSIVFPGFPAELLYEFRLHSVLTATVMWLVLGTVFGAALHRWQPTAAQATPQEVLRAAH